MDDIDPKKVVVDADGTIKLTEPEKVVPPETTVLNFAALQAEQNERIFRKVQLEKQSISVIAEIDNLTAEIASWQPTLDEARAKNPGVNFGAEPALIDEPPAVG